MKTRFKTFGEFSRQITIARRLLGGRLIVCKLNKSVLIKGPDLWNSAATKKSFLVKLYIDEVLKKKELSPKIMRIESFELLGLRCRYKKDIVVISNAWEVVNTETGEVDTMLLVSSVNNKFRLSPYKILQSQIDEKV